MPEPDLEKIAAHYAAILKELGADLTAEGMLETPKRAAQAIVEMTEGSRMDTDRLTKMFKAECQRAICHDMVIVESAQRAAHATRHKMNSQSLLKPDL